MLEHGKGHVITCDASDRIVIGRARRERKRDEEEPTFRTPIPSNAYLLFRLFDGSKQEDLVFMLKIAFKISFVQRFHGFERIFELDSAQLDLQLLRIITFLR